MNCNNITEFLQWEKIMESKIKDKKDYILGILLVVLILMVGIICFLSVPRQAVFADEYEFFGIDIEGKECSGGLYLNTKEGLDNHVEMLLRTGKKQVQEAEETKKFYAIMDKYKKQRHVTEGD